MDILGSQVVLAANVTLSRSFNIIKIDDDVGLGIQDLLLPYNYRHPTLFGDLWH